MTPLDQVRLELLKTRYRLKALEAQVSYLEACSPEAEAYYWQEYDRLTSNQEQYFADLEQVANTTTTEEIDYV